MTNVSTGQTRFYMPEPMVRRGEGAIEVFTRHLARQPAPRGITVNTIAVGRAIAALLDDSDRWVTGQRIEASGVSPVAPWSISTYADSPLTSLQDQSEAPRRKTIPCQSSATETVAPRAQGRERPARPVAAGGVEDEVHRCDRVLEARRPSTVSSRPSSQTASVTPASGEIAPAARLLVYEISGSVSRPADPGWLTPCGYIWSTARPGGA